MYCNVGFQIKDAAWNASDIRCNIPVKKGDVMTLVYTNMSFNHLRFIYAEGEV